MAGPWEDYKPQPQGVQPHGPWDDYKPSSNTAWTPSNSQDATTQSLKQAALTGLGGAVKGLDYVRGATTGPAIASLLGVTNPQDQADQLKFNKPYPTVVPLLERKFGQFPEGPKVSDVFPSAKGKWYDATTKGAVDVGLTALSDPVTYASLGLSAAARGGEGTLAAIARALGLANETGLTAPGRVARAVVNPLEAGLEGASKANYGKAFEQTDRYGAQMGKPQAVSDILRENGFVGNMDKAGEVLSDVNAKAGKEIGSAVTEAGAKGATVPAATAFQPALDQMDHLRSLGNADANAAADAIGKQLADLVNTHGWEIPIEKAQDLKSFLDNPVYKSAGPSLAQGEASGAKAMANEAITQDVLKPGVENAMPTSLKPDYMRAKSAYASTDPKVLENLRQASNKAKELRGAFGASDISAMLLGSGLGAGISSVAGHGIESGAGLGALSALAVKQGKQAYQSTGARTLRGAIQQGLGPGTGGLLDVGVREGLEKSQNPWGAIINVGPPATKGMKRNGKDQNP